MLKTSRTAHEIAFKPVMFSLPYLYVENPSKPQNKGNGENHRSPIK
jgi:hypothetical protein